MAMGNRSWIGRIRRFIAGQRLAFARMIAVGTSSLTFPSANDHVIRRNAHKGLPPCVLNDLMGHSPATTILAFLGMPCSC